MLDRDEQGVPDIQFVYPSGFKIGLTQTGAGAFAGIHNSPERAKILASGVIDFTTANGSLLSFAPIHTDGWRVWYAPSTLTTTDGKVYTFDRDSAGRLTRLTDPQGRWLRFSYRDVSARGKGWQAVATVTAAPVPGQWTEIKLPPEMWVESSKVRLTVPRGARVAEVQFFANGVTGPLPIVPGAPGSGTFDGNSSTSSDAGALAAGLANGQTIRPISVRFLSAPGSEQLLTGARLEVCVVNPLAITHSVIARVETSDSRAVDYEYAVSPQKNQEQVVLTVANYGEGTAARYSYSTQADSYGDQALLVSADDPRYAGPAKKIHYDYYQPVRDNQRAGTIKAEINPTTGHAWARLELDATKPLKRVVSYSDDRFHTYELVNNDTKAVASRTDSLGRKIQFEHSQSGGRPVAIVDYAGRRQETQRGTHGQVLSTRDDKGRTLTNQRDDRGRRTQTTDYYGRVTKIDRDAAGRIQRITKPTGQVHEFTRDSAGRVVVYTGTKGRVTATYDAQGNRISITDALGNTLYATRDTHGRVIAVTDSLGRVTRHEYNEGGLVTKTTTPDGQNRTFSYDNYGRKIAETDAAGRTATFAYDDLSRMTKQMDFAGRVTTYEFSEFPGGCGSCTLSPRPTRIVGPDGVATAFLYDAEGRVLARTVGSGTEAETTTSYDYDMDNNLIATTDPLGQVTRSTYDDERHRLTSTDPLGRVTGWSYDERGNVTGITTPGGAVSRYQYDDLDHRITTSDAAGNITRFVYDTAGRVTENTNAKREVTRNTYDASGRKTATVYADGKGDTWEYDAVGRVTRTISRDGLVTATIYDSANHPSTITQAVSGAPIETSTFTYDTLGHRLTATDPLSRTTRWSYDTHGNVLTTIRADGQVGARNTYDAQDNLIATADAAGATTTFTYDAARNQTSLTDARGNTYRFTYDALRHKTAMNYPDGSQEKWAYDAAGNLIAYTTRAGATKTIAYNGANQPLIETWSAGSGMNPVNYTYDGAGRLRWADNGQTKLGYQYDALGRLSTEETDLAALVPGLKVQTVDYDYDALGRRSMLTYPDQTKVSYDYDMHGRLSTIDTQGGGKTPLVTYAYDEKGRIEKLTRDNGVVTSYTYDMAGQLTDLTHAKGSTVLAGTHYELDPLGRRTAQTREDNISETYQYDATSQLTGVDYGTTSKGKETFAYDPVGNRTKTSVLVGGVPSPRVTNYAANNLNQYTKTTLGELATPFAYDPNGNLLNDGKQTYAYDAQNRLTSVETVGGASRPDAIRAEFFYDPRNRCVLRKYYKAGSQGQWVLNANDSRALTYDAAWNLLTERTLDGKQVGEYIHGQRSDEILRAEIPQTSDPRSQTQNVYSLADALGSTVALTDKQGKVMQRYRYTAYGTPAQLTASYQISNTVISAYRFLFTGREWLGAVGLNDHRNRHYSPKIGRWLTNDPIGHQGGLNLYAYIGNGGTNLTDPTGFFAGSPPPIPGPILASATTGAATAALYTGGVVLVSFAAGYEIGKYIDNVTGFSDWFADWWTSSPDNPTPVASSDPTYPSHGQSPGRDSCDNCLPCPAPPPPWQHTDHSHYPWYDHWHWYEINQDPETCNCYAYRQTGVSSP